MQKKKRTQKKSEDYKPLLQHTESCAQDIALHHENHDRFISRVVFWTSIIVVALANIISAAILIPIIAAISGWSFYIILSTLAVVMGFLYNLLLIDIAHLERSHHLFARVIIPVIAAVNVGALVSIANIFASALSLGEIRNPFAIGIVYGFAFILPYLIDQFRISRNQKPLLKSAR